MGKEKWSGLFWVGVGVLICIGALRLSLGTLRNPGPGFLPFLTGALLAALSFAFYIQSRRSVGQEAKPFWRNRDRGTKMVLTVFALLAYGLLIEQIGFATTTFVFLIFLLKVVEPQRWRVAILGSVLISGVAYGIFELLLQSQLPKGPWEVF